MRKKIVAKIFLLTFFIFFLTGQLVESVCFAEKLSYYQEGRNYLKQGKYKEAEELFKKAIARKPGHYEAVYSLGLIYHMRNEQDKAIKYFKRAIRIKPNYADAYWYLARVYYDLIYHNKEAIEYAEKAKELYQQQGNKEMFEAAEDFLRGITCKSTQVIKSGR